MLTTENMFSGPCFGDCSTSNSPTTSIPDAPSPSPLLLPFPVLSQNKSTLTNAFPDETSLEQNALHSQTLGISQESWPMNFPANSEHVDTDAESSLSVTLYEDREDCTENQFDPSEFEDVIPNASASDDNISVSNHHRGSYLQDLTNTFASSQPSQPSAGQENYSTHADPVSSDNSEFVPSAVVSSSLETPESEFDETYVETMSRANSPSLNPTKFDTSSSPPSSSPPLLFSSSPLASSQSSIPSDDFQTSSTIPKQMEEHAAIQAADTFEEAPHVPTCPSSGLSVEDGTCGVQPEDFYSNFEDSSSGSFPQEMDSDENENENENENEEPFSNSQYASLAAACFDPPMLAEDQDLLQVEFSDSIPSQIPCPSSSPLPPSSSPPEELPACPIIDEETMSIEDVDVCQENEANGIIWTSSNDDLLSSPVVGQVEDEAVIEMQPSDPIPPDSPSESILGKRKADSENIHLDALHQTQFKPETPITSKDVAFKMPVLPNPKRSTIAAQKVQYKKLSTPFRSPVMKRPKIEASPINVPATHPVKAIPESPISTDENNVPLASDPQSAFQPTDSKKKHRTPRASGQFKSPLSTDTASKAISSVRMTPTIQALERKLQVLKRAVKVKQDGDEETLEALVKKWTEAGREVAWEVWELVKDRASSEDQGWGQSKGIVRAEKGGFEDSWGWKEKSSEKVGLNDNERNWGWDVVPRGTSDDVADETIVAENHEDVGRSRCDDDEGDEERKQDTLGTMLMQLGIAPETLGWNEEEGTFQDG